MTEEEKQKYQDKFKEVWGEFSKEHPDCSSMLIETIANYFFEKGREDAFNRVWEKLKK